MEIEKFYKEKVPIFGFLIAWMADNDMDYGPVVVTTGALMIFAALALLGVSGGFILSFFIAMAPVWLPIILFFVFFHKWSEAIWGKFYISQGRTTLRIRLPQEVFKSPEAMEFVLSQAHATQNPDNYFQTYIDGKQPLPMSLEIVSIGGELRFYVNLPTKKVKNAFEATLYSQYPGVEVVEEPVDYAAEIPLDSKDWSVFSVHMNKKKDQEFPIKTYIDFGLNTMPKEEEKVDPLTPMLEMMAAIKPHERIYTQIVCVPHRKSAFENGQLKAKPTWEEGVAKKINEIMKRDPDSKAAKEDGAAEEIARLTPGERGTIEAMERNAGKYPYEVNIRFIYASNGDFDPSNISSMIRGFSQYDIIGRNQVGVRWRTDFNYKDYIPGKKEKVIAALKKQELTEYKMRVVWPKNGAGAAKVFTAEELATMWHLPGQVAVTPTIERIPSTRAEAPSNLPTGG